MSETTRIIEVNGVKVEVDLRNATVIENYKVGDSVKVLQKEYSNSYKVNTAVVTDIFHRTLKDGTEEGAIQLLVVEEGYQDVDLKFIVYGEKTEDFSIGHFNKYEKRIPTEQLVSKFDKMIEKKQDEIRVLEGKKAAYLEYFEEVTNEVV